MSTLVSAMVVAFAVVWHLALTALAYYDAGRVGLEPPRKWAAIVFFIPIIGAFVYLFERSELDYDPETDPYRGRNFNIHPSRADDTMLRSRGDDRPSPDGEDDWGEGDEWGTDGEEDAWGSPRDEDEREDERR